MLNIIDFIIIGIIALSLIISLFRGFVKEVMSLVSWVAAFFVASQFYPYLASYFTQIESIYIRNGVAIVILLIATLIVGSIINYIISQIVDKTGLSGTDRVLGACFGLLRGVLIIAAIIFLAKTFTSVNQTEIWKNSQLIPHFNYIVDWFFQEFQKHSDLINNQPA